MKTIQLILIILVGMSACAQYEYPQMKEIPFVPVNYQGDVDDNAAALFSPERVNRIEVDVAFDLFDWINDDGVDYVEVNQEKAGPAVFRFYTNEHGTGTPLVISGIGMRGRGGYSFDHAPKKKYKIRFPEDNRFFGLKKINLNSNYGDGSMMREKLAYDFFNTIGVPSGRTCYSRLYINNEYMGLYLIVEQVGDNFFSTRFGTTDGNCYKDNWSELDWVSSDTADYLSTPANMSPALELTTDDTGFDPSDIIEFVSVLNDTPDDQFAEAIRDKFLVHEFLSALAANCLLATIDDYWYYAHNFMLYNYFGKFMWIPWDLDHSYGAQWAGFVVETADTYAFAPRNTDNSSGRRPLIDRILGVPEFLAYYEKCLASHIGTFFNEDTLYPKIDRIRALISESALSDPLQNLSEASFNAAIETENETWVRAIKPFITARKNFVLAEIGDIN